MTRPAEAIFQHARLIPPAERATYLKGVCGNDVALRAVGLMR